MDPDYAAWVRQMMGSEEIPRQIPMKLKDMVGGLLPNSRAILVNHHSAGNDACMHWLLCKELVRLASV